MKSMWHMEDDEGSVMLVTLVVMLLLTLMGLAATQSSIFEIRMTRNQLDIDEAFARAEMAMNLTVREFRMLDETPGGVGNAQDVDRIAALLNDRDYSENDALKYVGTRSLNGEALARVEIRRIYLPDPGESMNVAGLSPQANSVPQLSHRYYDGSIDRKRFAITVTATKKGSNEPSYTWVQKGVALPAEQDRDEF